MKLEMRAWDMDVRVELEDGDNEDGAGVLLTVKDLIDTLSRFDKVNVSIATIADPEDDDTEDDDTDEHENDAQLTIAA
jgi:hypothetical protein